MSLTVWVSVALLILVNALYVAAEFGAVGVRRSRVRRLSDKGNRLARQLLPYVEHPGALDRYVAASQIGITLSSLTLGAYGQFTFGAPFAAVLADRFHLDPATAASAAGVAILVGLSGAQVVLGELVPKSLALQYPTGVALGTVLPMRWSLRVFRPFIAALNGSATLLLRLAGASSATHRHIHSPDEIELLIEESGEGGLLEADDQQRLRRALRLGLKTARDLMVPLPRLTMLDADTAWDEVVRVVASSPFSRLPVYRGSREQIVGVLKVKDLVERYVAAGPVPLTYLVRPVVRLSDDLPADRVIAMLRERRTHLGVVVDRQDRALGLLTIHDVLAALLDVRTAGRRER